MLLFQMSAKPFYVTFYAHQIFFFLIKCINLYDIIYVTQEKSILFCFFM